jgi:hypothetical protein
MEVYGAHPPCSLTSISSIPLTHTSPPPCSYFTVLSLLLISKWMFKGFLDASHCGYTSLWSIRPLPLLSLPPSLPTPFSTAFSTHPYVLHLHRCDVLRCHWCSVILSSFPSFPEFHWEVPLLHTCSTSEFVCDRACLCVHVYLWIHLPRMRENMCSLSGKDGLPGNDGWSQKEKITRKERQTHKQPNTTSPYLSEYWGQYEVQQNKAKIRTVTKCWEPWRGAMLRGWEKTSEGSLAAWGRDWRQGVSFGLRGLGTGDRGWGRFFSTYSTINSSPPPNEISMKMTNIAYIPPNKTHLQFCGKESSLQ